MSNAPLAGEDKFDLDSYRGMDPVQMMLAIRRDLEYKLPRVGETKQRLILAGKEYVRTTWRCDQPNCYYVCTPRDNENLDEIKNHHVNGTTGNQCPTPPRRESLPSGLDEIEKLWREVDDVMDALQAKEAYREMEGGELKAYVRGLAFSIVMKDHELWPDIKAVSRQAAKRWKMRKGQLPWEATPTRHSNNANLVGTNSGWVPAQSPAKAAPARKAAPRKAAAPALPEAKVKAIKGALASGMFEPADIALMYSCTVAQVNSLK